jgi:hypothetical protein
MNVPGQWFLCVGCGLRAAFFPEGFAAMGYEPGCVMHEDPKCAWFSVLSAEQFAALNVSAVRIPPPNRAHQIERD